MKILVVEDSATIRVQYLKMLDEMGHKVTTAADGLAGLHHAVSEEFDLILMDIKLLCFDGLYITRAIRKHERQKELTRVPVVAVTATDTTDDECREAGMDGCVRKPISREGMRRLTEKWDAYNKAYLMQKRRLSS